MKNEAVDITLAKRNANIVTWIDSFFIIARIHCWLIFVTFYDAYL